jgi:hypothetical protein
MPRALESSFTWRRIQVQLPPVGGRPQPWCAASAMAVRFLSFQCLLMMSETR